MSERAVVDTLKTYVDASPCAGQLEWTARNQDPLVLAQAAGTCAAYRPHPVPAPFTSNECLHALDQSVQCQLMDAQRVLGTTIMAAFQERITFLRFPARITTQEEMNAFAMMCIRPLIIDHTTAAMHLRTHQIQLAQPLLPEELQATWVVAAPSDPRLTNPLYGGDPVTSSLLIEFGSDQYFEKTHQYTSLMLGAMKYVNGVVAEAVESFLMEAMVEQATPFLHRIRPGRLAAAMNLSGFRPGYALFNRVMTALADAPNDPALAGKRAYRDVAETIVAQLRKEDRLAADHRLPWCMTTEETFARMFRDVFHTQEGVEDLHAFRAVATTASAGSGAEQVETVNFVAELTRAVEEGYRFRPSPVQDLTFLRNQDRRHSVLFAESACRIARTMVQAAHATGMGPVRLDTIRGVLERYRVDSTTLTLRDFAEVVTQVAQVVLWVVFDCAESRVPVSTLKSVMADCSIDRVYHALHRNATPNGYQDSPTMVIPAAIKALLVPYGDRDPGTVPSIVSSTIPSPADLVKAGIAGLALDVVSFVGYVATCTAGPPRSDAHIRAGKARSVLATMPVTAYRYNFQGHVRALLHACDPDETSCAVVLNMFRKFVGNSRTVLPSGCSWTPELNQLLLMPSIESAVRRIMLEPVAYKQAIMEATYAVLYNGNARAFYDALTVCKWGKGEPESQSQSQSQSETQSHHVRRAKRVRVHECPECPLCASDSAPLLTASCGHVACAACVARAATVTLVSAVSSDSGHQKTYDPAQCYEPKCTGRYGGPSPDVTDVLPFAGPSVYALSHISDADMEHEAMDSASSPEFQCRVCSRKLGAAPPGSPVATCTWCFAESCVTCHELAHPGIVCVRVLMTGKPGTKTAPISVQDLLTEAKVVKCPGCSQLVTKDQGCNHMTCDSRVKGTKRACGTEFCYQCEARLTASTVASHYTTSSCRQLADSAQSALEMERERLVRKIRRAADEGVSPLSGRRVLREVADAAIAVLQSTGVFEQTVDDL